MKLKIKDYVRALEDELDRLDYESIDRVAETIWECYRNRRRLVVCGNGGSGATASHFAADLHKGLLIPSQDSLPWEVVSLCDSMALVTAWSNDTHYANVFAAQAKCWLRPGDLLLAFSTSGMSENVIAAVSEAKKLGAYTIGFCGNGGSRLAALADDAISLPSKNMQIVEDIHMVLAHAVFRALLDKATLIAAPEHMKSNGVHPVEVAR